MQWRLWIEMLMVWALLGSGRYLLLTCRPKRRKSLTERRRPYHVRRVSDETKRGCEAMTSEWLSVWEAAEYLWLARSAFPADGS